MLTAFSVKVLVNSLGLVIDISGAALVFFNSPVISYQTFLYNKSERPLLKKKEESINKRSKFGFVLLATGFIFQLMSNFIS